MNSIVFTDDEARYLRFLMRHIEKPPDETRASWMSNVPSKEFEPVGEFNTLVIGAPGVGKTSLLEKVSATWTTKINCYLICFYQGKPVTDIPKGLLNRHSLQ